MIAIQGLPVNAETGMIDAGGAGVGFGFLGGIVGGFLAGYVILLLEKVFSKIPASLNGLKAIFLYPLCSTAIVGLVMLGISGPMAAINQGMMDFLQSLGNSGPVILGLAIGCMCAFDMGGPVNKAAYATGTFLLGTALEAGVGTETYNFGTNFMAAVSAACIVPPLITTFAVVVGKKYFSQEDHDAGIVNLILGCTHITEGAIPFMTKNIWPVMPIMMLGSSIASILTIFFNVHDPAPHGGFLVLPVVENGPLWVLAILIGAVVGGILFVAFKKYDFEKNQKAAPVARSVEAPKAAAVEAPKEEAADFVKVENVFVAEDFASRDEALSFVSNQAVKAGIASDADAVMNAFLAREAEGTTGMMRASPSRMPSPTPLPRLPLSSSRTTPASPVGTPWTALPSTWLSPCSSPVPRLAPRISRFCPRSPRRSWTRTSVPSSRVPPTPPRSPRRSTPAWSNPTVREYHRPLYKRLSPSPGPSPFSIPPISCGEIGTV